MNVDMEAVVALVERLDKSPIDSSAVPAVAALVKAHLDAQAKEHEAHARQYDEIERYHNEARAHRVGRAAQRLEVASRLWVAAPGGSMAFYMEPSDDPRVGENTRSAIVKGTLRAAAALIAANEAFDKRDEVAAK